MTTNNAHTTETQKADNANKKDETTSYKMTETCKKADNTPKKWEVWAGKKKPSMKRRSEHHNYYERGIYMITMATEGRKPLFGTLKGNPDVAEGNTNVAEGTAPHVVLSPLGEKVKECWNSITHYHPQIQTLKLCIMPDHIHGILFVHEKMEKHLGHVVEGFKTGTRKAARELGVLPPYGVHTALLAQSTQQKKQNTTPLQTNATPLQTNATPLQTNATPLETSATTLQTNATPLQTNATPLQADSPQSLSRHTAAGRMHGLLWEPGYNDRILQGKGQLERMNAYLDDNPRRLLLKRQHPQLFTQRHHFTINDTTFEGIGNRFLLDYPMKIQVQCSRSMTQDAIDYQKEQTLAEGEKGAVVVSPCISQGEQQIATAAMDAGIPLIVLLLKGFHPYFKPQPRYLEACTKGLLLMLSPFPYQNEKIENMRQRCLQLNAIAAAICL